MGNRHGGSHGGPSGGGHAGTGGHSGRHSAGVKDVRDKNGKTKRLKSGPVDVTVVRANSVKIKSEYTTLVKQQLLRRLQDDCGPWDTKVRLLLTCGFCANTDMILLPATCGCRPSKQRMLPLCMFSRQLRPVKFKTT